jgi:hypothetical protein
LPKLTVAVFDRPDCPKWAKWAIISPGGYIAFFKEKPEIYENGIVLNGDYVYIWEKKYSNKNWQNSIVERPKNRVNWDEVEEICCNSKLTFKEKKQELPDWCKVGEWVYLCNGTYSRIVSINDCHVNLANGISVGKNSIHEEMVPARLRPYNAEEMRGLVNYRQ